MILTDSVLLLHFSVRFYLGQINHWISSSIKLVFAVTLAAAAAEASYGGYGGYGYGGYGGGYYGGYGGYGHYGKREAESDPSVGYGYGGKDICLQL